MAHERNLSESNSQREAVNPKVTGRLRLWGTEKNDPQPLQSSLLPPSKVWNAINRTTFSSKFLLGAEQIGGYRNLRCGSCFHRLYSQIKKSKNNTHETTVKPTRHPTDGNQVVAQNQGASPLQLSEERCRQMVAPGLQVLIKISDIQKYQNIQNFKNNIL